MEKLKIGIIGTGNISGLHMEGYKAQPDRCEVVAVCDIDEPKVKAYAERHGVSRWYTDYNEMMEKEQLDAVSVCTWNSAHKGATIAALKGGAHVICEKPMAMSAEEGEEMKKTAEDCGKLLMIGLVRRFSSEGAVMRKFIDSGDIGEIYYAKATYLRRNGCPGGWFGDKRYAGGGPLIDLGVHIIDFTRYLAGCPKPVSVYGVTFNNIGDSRSAQGKSWVSSSTGLDFQFNVEDSAFAMVRYDNGFVAQIEASFNLNHKKDLGRVEIFGTKAGVKIEDGIEFYTDKNGYLMDMKPASYDVENQFNKEFRHFLDCIIDGTPCICSAEEGVQVMKILDAIYLSAETKSEVKIV